MSLRPAMFCAAALVCTLACTSDTPPASPSNSTSAASAASESAPAAGEPKPAAIVEAEGPTPAGAVEPAPPPWFDASKLEHVRVVSHQASTTERLAGGQASAMVLELEPQVSTESCIAMVQGIMGASIPDLPAPSSGPDGRQSIQGQTEAYHYASVCGEAKGKPTLYLSYTTRGPDQ